MKTYRYSPHQRFFVSISPLVILIVLLTAWRIPGQTSPVMVHTTRYRCLTMLTVRTSS